VPFRVRQEITATTVKRFSPMPGMTDASFSGFSNGKIYNEEAII